MDVLVNAIKMRMIPHKDAFLAIHPNSRMIDNPDYDAQLPEDEVTNPKEIQQYTDSEWIDQYVFEHLRTQVIRGQKKLYNSQFTEQEL